MGGRSRANRRCFGRGCCPTSPERSIKNSCCGTNILGLLQRPVLSLDKTAWESPTCHRPPCFWRTSVIGQECRPVHSRTARTVLPAKCFPHRRAWLSIDRKARPFAGLQPQLFHKVRVQDSQLLFFRHEGPRGPRILSEKSASSPLRVPTAPDDLARI